MAIITLGNSSCQINDLDPAIDAAFVAYYHECFAGQAPNAQAFDAAALPNLPKLSSWMEHDAYFNNFTPHWNLLLQQQQPTVAARIWPWALRPVLALEARGVGPFHKGTPYYFWGMTALLASDFEGAYLLLNRAFEEDIRTHGTATPNTPGFFLLTLNDQRVDQALASWVQFQAAGISGRLSQYRLLTGRRLDLPSFRQRFLSVPSMRHAVNMYCYAMARAGRFAGLPAQLWEGPFPSQVAFATIFDLCLVVDEALAPRFTKDWRFNYLAASLATAASLGLSGPELAEINSAFDSGLQPTLNALANGTFSLNSGKIVSGLGASLALTYCCRNWGAHTLAPAGLSAREYDILVAHVNNTLFLAVELLY